MPSLGPAITAVSSPPGRSGRGLVRASGAGFQSLLAGLIDPVPLPRHPVRAHLVSGGDLAGLPVLAVWFAGPASYSGEDILEIQVPGHPMLLDRLVQRVQAWLRETDEQARQAEPGEFTRRAYLNGRINLLQAEGIAATIAAETMAQVQAAAVLRSGDLGKDAEALVSHLAELLARVEAGIDFTDQEDVVAIEPRVLLSGLEAVGRQIRQWLDRSRTADETGWQPRVVLAGVPNAGKSTLFNALVGHERVVSSSRPGSTRDVLVEPVRLPGEKGAASQEILLADAAGLDDAVDAMGSAMQQAVQRAIDQADLVLRLQTQDLPPPSGRIPPGKPVLDVWTQIDRRPAPDDWSGLVVSAKIGQGLDELRRAMAGALAGDRSSLGAGRLILQQRHRSELETATRALEEAAEQVRVDQADAPELAADAMRRALDALGAVGGKMDPDEVIGLVFSKFCVGK